MPWWAWLIIVPVALIISLAVGMAMMVLRFRKAIQREFVLFLKEAWSELEVIKQRHLLLEFRLPDGVTGQMDLRNLYANVLMSRAYSPDARRDLYDRYVRAIREGQIVGSEPQDPRDHPDRIMPRLVTRDFFATNSEVVDLPNIPLGDTGLYVVFVLDGEESVMYLGREHLNELQMSLPQVLEQALANLRKTFEPEKPVRQTIADQTAYSVKMLDTYDAARVLLLPECLHEGEMLIAAIPDRDTLAFVPAPADGDLAALDGLLAPDSDRLLLDRLLKVTNEGIELAS